MEKVSLSTEAEMLKKLNKNSFDTRAQLLDLMKSSPIPKEELLTNIGVYLDRRIISKFLFINELYQQVLHIHGNIMEFGVRYGQNIILFANLRGIYEPYNNNRKIIGFDTFEGFPSLDSKDGNAKWNTGDFGVPEKYEDYIAQLLRIQEQLAPLGGINKNELIKGDATVTIKEYLKQHPETIIALAYFDFDIYKPTKDCLEAIKPYLSKSAVIGFDEINYDEFPGETVALREVLGTKNFVIRHSKFRTQAGYLVYE